MNKTKNDILPKFGIGPYYFLSSLTLTILTLLYFNSIPFFQSGIIVDDCLRKIFIFFSIVSMILGFLLF